MQKILQELYRGNICPATKQFNRVGAYADAMEKLVSCENDLHKYLRGKPRKSFDDFMEASIELSAIAQQEDFVAGFRLGARMMLEVMDENDGQFKELTD